ncbi:cytochrome c oxidase subunit 3 [Candidatus Binatus sp.]|uniref:cytochrome c oxidase subunit 3 n=2 Tax=Candidatus Binatus sp. TaxID=2811406 RepID=UPI003BDE5521
MAAATPLRPVSDLKRAAAFGSGGSGPAGSLKSADPTLGVLIFIGSEVMLFGGLLSAFLVSRASAPFWPPANQPRLPVAVTGLNTGLLVLSGLTMWRVVRLLRQHDKTGAMRWMGITITLGALFLAIQGTEWAGLIRFGLTMTSSLYGGMFYLIVGAHALHLVAAVAVLLFVASRVWRGRYEVDYRGVVACSVYWSFVVILWPIIYALVYFS